MFATAPPLVLSAARGAAAEAARRNVSLPADVEAMSALIRAEMPIDVDDLASLVATHRPGWTADDVAATLAWAALGGAASEGWTAHHAPTAVAAAQDSRRFPDGTETLYDQLDGYIHATLITAIRKMSRRIANAAGKHAAAQAAAPLPRQPETIAEARQTLPAFAAALTADDEDLTGRLVEDQTDGVERLLLAAWAALVARIATQLDVNPETLWAQARPAVTADVDQAVDVFRRRVTDYTLAVLDDEDNIGTALDRVNPPPSIARTVVAVAAGADVVASPTAVDLSLPAGGPTVLTDLQGVPVSAAGEPAAAGLFGPTMNDTVLAGFTAPTLTYEWEHRTATNRFDPHYHLSGVTVPDIAGSGPDMSADVLANPNDFPSSDHYHPGDHRGCNCILVPIVDFGNVTPADITNPVAVSVDG